MDAWHRTFEQLRAVVRGLSIAQRTSLLVVSLGILTGLGWLIYTQTVPAQEFLLGGKSFSREELSQTQDALKAAGLTHYQIVGQRISVPSRDADRYTAAAAARQTLPAQFAAEFDRMQSKVNLFTSTEQRRELLEEARKARLAQILRAIPEVEDAVVEWDRPRQTNLFRPAPPLAAHVSVKPRGGRELSPELVESLKLFIAGALAGAHVDDVTVVDMNTSHVYGRRSSNDVARDRLTSLARQHESEYTTQIARALSYIPDVLVTVNVELASARRESLTRDSFVNAKLVPIDRRPYRDRSQSSSSNRGSQRAHSIGIVAPVRALSLEPDASLADAPEWVEQPDCEVQPVDEIQKSVRVAVSIPESYYSAIARQRGVHPGESLVQDSAFRAALASIKAETQRDVRDQLTPLLPHGRGLAEVSVTSHTPVLNAAEANTTAQPSTAPLDWETLLATWKIPLGSAIGGLCLAGFLFRFRARPQLTVSTVVAGDEPALPETEQPAFDSYAGDEPLTSHPTAPHPSAAVLAELAELEHNAPSIPIPHEAPLAFLDDLTVDAACNLLQSEHPQTIALVATRLAPARAASILHALPDSLRWDVTQRLARIGPATTDVLCQVAASLKSRLSASPQLASSDSQVTQHPVVAAVDSALEFDDLCFLDGPTLTAVIESVDPRSRALALLDRSEPFKQHLLAVLPKAIASEIRQHLRHLGPVRLMDIDEAQQALLHVVQDFVSQGLISLPTAAA